MPQLSISDAPAVAYAGQIAEPGAPTFARSCLAEGANVVAGMPVKRGTDPQRQVEPFEAGDLPDFANFAGVVILETTRAYDANAIEDGDSLGVMREGSIYMDFSEAVTAGERVALTLASGALTGVAEGTVSTDAIVVLPGLRIASTISAAGLAIVEVDLMGSGDAAVEAGEYTPTLTDVTNVAASALVAARYQRIGTNVVVHFSVTIDPTSAAATELGISLPIASDLAAAADLCGSANSGETVGEPAIIVGDSTNDRASLAFTAVGTGVVQWSGSFSYQIL